MERELASRADQRVLRWFGQVSYDQKGIDGGSKWRSGTRETEVWLDGWCERGLGQQRNDGEAARQCAKNRKEWRTLVYYYYVT